MDKEDSFDKYLNASEFASHNYIGSGAFNLGLNRPEDLPDYIGASLDQFNAINPSNDIINEGALLDPTCLSDACINQNLGCKHHGDINVNKFDIYGSVRIEENLAATKVRFEPNLLQFQDNGITLDGSLPGSVSLEKESSIGDDLWGLATTTSFNSEFTVESLNQVSPLIGGKEHAEVNDLNVLAGGSFEMSNEHALPVVANDFNPASKVESGLNLLESAGNYFDGGVYPNAIFDNSLGSQESTCVIRDYDVNSSEAIDNNLYAPFPYEETGAYRFGPEDALFINRGKTSSEISVETSLLDGSINLNEGSDLLTDLGRLNNEICLV